MPDYTKENLVNIVKKMESGGEDEATIRSFVQQYKTKIKPEEPSLISKIGTGAKEFGTGLAKGVGRAVETGVDVTGGLALSALSVLPGDLPPTDPLKAIKMFSSGGDVPELKTKTPIEKAGSFVGELGTGIALGGGLAKNVPKVAAGAPKALKFAAGLGKEVVRDLPFLAKTATGGDAVELGKDVALSTAINAAMPGVAKLFQKPAEALTDVVKKGISKGVKPTVIGKKTLKGAEQFFDNAENAVTTIVKNKDALNIVDEVGEAIAHPKTAAQFAQAIDQAKQLVYKQYHELAEQAGDAGSRFNLEPIVKKLSNIADPNNKKIPPKVRQYAESLFDELSELDGVTPDIIEARIADLNKSLAGYYDGRTAKAVAQVDASVANAMREQLNKQITEATGNEAYQGLKKQYGALSAIEKEVNKRAIVNARQATKGLTDLTDIFTGGDLIAGIVSMNPALLARGVAGRGIKEVFKSINDPEKAIEKMFKDAYKAIEKQTKIQSRKIPTLSGL